MPDKTALESSIFIRTLNVYMNGEENQAVSESVVTIQPSLRSSFAPLLLQRENQSHAVEARAQRRAQRVECLPVDILFKVKMTLHSRFPSVTHAQANLINFRWHDMASSEPRSLSDSRNSLAYCERGCVVSPFPADSHWANRA